ncbi:MAG: hypothetical protein HC831_21095 [Chloroflexia bacterium]|nr:hypothetical protein [Chloroflexia bacterium]
MREWKKKKCFNAIKPLLRFFSKLQCLDLSDLGLDYNQITEQTGKISKNITKINIRNNDLKEHLPFGNCSPAKSTQNFHLGYEFLNARENKNIVIDSTNNATTIVVDYDDRLFTTLLEISYKSQEIYIFLSSEALEKGKEYLKDINRIRVLSKVQGF